MKVTTLDVETTIFEKGNPFSRRNKLCYVGIDVDGSYSDFDIEYGNSPYGHHLPTIKETLESSELVVGFNLKFDLHWIKRYVPNITFPRRVWDCQLAEFILSNQQWVYPSLNESLVRRNLGTKLDVVNAEYWSHGLDTPVVPRDILTEYLRTDVTQTKALYLKQVEDFAKRDPKLLTLFRIQCADLLVLQEMEFHGMYFDVDKAEDAN
jgi:DNA polymerase I-like protein with 3'-5' exonuclease and polymerase domains